MGTGLAAQKNNNFSEGSAATAFTTQDLKIGSATPDTTFCTCKTKVYKKIQGYVFADSIPPRYRRKLRSTHFSNLNKTKIRIEIVVPDHGEIWWTLV